MSTLRVNVDQLSLTVEWILMYRFTQHTLIGRHDFGSDLGGEISHEVQHTEHSLWHCGDMRTCHMKFNRTCHMMFNLHCGDMETCHMRFNLHMGTCHMRFNLHCGDMSHEVQPSLWDMSHEVQPSMWRHGDMSHEVQPSLWRHGDMSYEVQPSLWRHVTWGSTNSTFTMTLWGHNYTFTPTMSPSLSMTGAFLMFIGPVPLSTPFPLLPLPLRWCPPLPPPLCPL